ncbi:MAG: hypothetical protein HYU88_01150 [Chloroflexi bacterium]|nr:hypothetical protein [Chloroflexota bacterium]
MVAALGIFLVVAIAAALALALQPLLRAKAEDDVEGAGAPDGDLLAERDAAIQTLRELDFDYQLGNLGEADYRALRERARQQALALLKASDDLMATQAFLEDELEREVLARRQRADVLQVLAARSAPAPSAAPARSRLASRVARRRPRVWLGAGALVGVAVVGGVAWLYAAARSAQDDQRPIAQLPATVQHAHALALLPGTNTVLLGHHDGLMRSDDGGMTWRPVATSITGDVMGLAVHPARPNVVFAAGHNVLTLSEDGGATWSPVQHDLPDDDIHALAQDPESPDTLYAVVAERGLFQSTDGGRRWTRLTDQVPRTTLALAVAVGGGRVLYLGTLDQGALGSPDGKRWGSANGFAGGLLPTRQVPALVSDPRSGDRYVAPSGQQVTGALYAATDRGLYKSVDGGNSWSRLALTADLAAVAVSPSDSRVLLAVDRAGRVFRSADRGVSWRGDGGR